MGVGLAFTSDTEWAPGAEWDMSRHVVLQLLFAGLVRGSLNSHLLGFLTSCACLVLLFPFLYGYLLSFAGAFINPVYHPCARNLLARSYKSHFTCLPCR